jgi:hypothetical protein
VVAAAVRRAAEAEPRDVHIATGAVAGCECYIEANTHDHSRRSGLHLAIGNGVRCVISVQTNPACTRQDHVLLHSMTII